MKFFPFDAARVHLFRPAAVLINKFIIAADFRHARKFSASDDLQGVALVLDAARRLGYLRADKEMDDDLARARHARRGQ